MKHIQAIVLLFSLLLGFGISLKTYATDINLVDVFDTNTLSVTLSEKDNLSQWIIDGEIKVLKDTTIEDATKSIDDATKISLSLPYALEVNTSYSLLTLFWAEGSIDFTTGEELVGQQITNQDIIGDYQTIESITIVDETTLELVYTTDVIDSIFEYKLLSELQVTSIENTTMEDNRITLYLEKDIVPAKDYILIVLSLMGQDGKEIELDNSIFDFMSPEYIEQQIGVQEQQDQEEISEHLEEDSVTAAQDAIRARIEARNQEKDNEEQEHEEQEHEEQEIELTAAGPEIDSPLTQNVAMLAESTPDTGAETWVLLLLTLFINTFFHFSRRKLA